LCSIEKENNKSKKLAVAVEKTQQSTSDVMLACIKKESKKNKTLAV